MSSETARIRRQIARSEAQCEALRDEISQLEDELDRLCEARGHITNAITQHEESLRRAEGIVCSRSFKSRSLASYARSMVETLNGSSARRATQGLRDTETETERRIAQVRQEIAEKRASLCSCENNTAALRRSLARAIQEEREQNA